MIDTWTTVARREPKFVGKRLSEIARMVLEGNISQSETYTAVKALSLGWLDIVEGVKDHYGQQRIDAA